MRDTKTVSLSPGNWLAIVSLCFTLVGAIIYQSNQLTEVVTTVESMAKDVSRNERKIERLENLWRIPQ